MAGRTYVDLALLKGISTPISTEAKSRVGEPGNSWLFLGLYQ